MQKKNLNGLKKSFFLFQQNVISYVFISWFWVEMKLECFCEIPPLAFTNRWKQRVKCVCLSIYAGSCLVPSSSTCVRIDEMMLILIWPFNPYANMCSVGGGKMSSNTQSNLIAPYYWEYFSVPMCLTQTHWYSLSRSYSTSAGRGRCRMEKGGTYSCLLLTIPYPTCEGWCQATTLVMHITEAQTASGDFVCACMRFCCNAF